MLTWDQYLPVLEKARHQMNLKDRASIRRKAKRLGLVAKYDYIAGGRWRLYEEGTDTLVVQGLTNDEARRIVETI